MTPPAATARRAAALLLLAATALALLAGPAAAHPLGNFTTNTSATLLPAEGVTEVVYVLDLAEIPTQRTRGAIEDAGGEQAWAAAECRRIADGQDLTVDGAGVPLSAEGADVALLPGEAGLEVLRLTCALEAATTDLPNPARMTYADTTAPDRIGWREVVAVGDGSRLLESDVPATSATDQLREYPEAEVSRTTTAALLVDPSGGPAAPAALRATDLQPVDDDAAGFLEGLVRDYTALVARQDLTIPFVLLAVVISIALGTAHAVAPGHGKTVIAAYLLGEGGHARQAVALGGTVAVTHTIGVLVLGVIVQTSTTLAPESLYPVLGVGGGVLFTALGVVLLRRAITGHGHDHAHDHDHDDHHHGHDHRHDHAHDEPARTGWRMLVLPGLAGGMVPSPSALLVLLGGIALDRTWFGVVLVLAYGVGMALALVGAGYLLHRVRFRVMDRLEGRTWARVSGALPVATSSLIVVGGLVIVARSLVLA